MSILREAWSITEVTRIVDGLFGTPVPERRVRGWVDEGLVPTREFKGTGERRPERFVDRGGLIKLALMTFLGSHLGDRSPLVREIVCTLPGDVTSALDGVDLEDGTPQDIKFILGSGEVVITPRFLKAIVAKLNAAQLTV